MATPELGGGPENPAAEGACEVILIMLSAYPGVWAWSPGEARGVFPKVLSPGDAKGFPYVETAGDSGVGS